MTAVDALQATLAAEHAAVYIYGALGGRTSQSATPTLYAAVRDAYLMHRSQRDQLTRTLRDLGVEPVASEVAYDAPDDLDTPEAIGAAAAALEDGCAATYAALVAETVGDQRRWAVTALMEAAVRQVDMGAAPGILPGAADRISS
jgi:hypothetical protein